MLVVVFTCNHCPTAQAYEDRIKQLAADYKDKKVAVVAISPNDPQAVRLDELGYTDVGDSLEDMKLRAKDKEFNFPYLYDGDDQKVSQAYGPVATPHVFVFDRQRKLRFAGRIDNSDKPDRVTSHDTRNAIEALLAGKPVPVEKTKVFGCSIKWSDKRDSAKKSLEKWAKEEVALETIDEKGIARPGEERRQEAAAGQRLGHVVRPVRRRTARVRDHEPHVPPPRFRVDHDLGRRPRGRKTRRWKCSRRSRSSARNYLFDGNDKYKLMEAVDREVDRRPAAHDPDRPRRQGPLSQVGPARSAGNQEGDRRDNWDGLQTGVAMMEQVARSVVRERAHQRRGLLGTPYNWVGW